MTKTIPKKKEWKKAKWLSEEALQIAEERREAKGKDTPNWMQSSNNSKKRLEGLFKWTMQINKGKQ